MNFRHFTVFRMTRELTIGDLGKLNEVLATKGFRKMGATERTVTGFAPPFPRYRPGVYMAVMGQELDFHKEFDPEMDGDREAFYDKPYSFINDSSNYLLMNFYRQEKVIVNEDIKRRVQERVEEIEAREVRKVYKAEKEALREDIISTILPHAQSRRKMIPVMFMPNGLLLVGETGRKVDDLLGVLRHIFGTLPISPAVTNLTKDVLAALTSLARHQGGDYDDLDTKGFRITDDFQLQEVAHDSPEIARMKNVDIGSDEIREFVVSGKAVTHANLAWKDEATFKTAGKLEIKSMKIDDAKFQDDGADSVEDLATVEYSETFIQANTLQQLLEDLYELCGGFAPIQEPLPPTTLWEFEK